jgi:polyisoprenoid-binding protein YceI
MNFIKALFLLLLLPLQDRQEEIYQVNTEESTIRWTGKKVLGEHHGTLQLDEGSFRLENGQLKGGNFTIDMRSLKNEDLEGDRREKLEDWLRSEEMFYTERYPYVRFTITSAEPSENSQRYRVEGELTIKEDTHSIGFPAIIKQDENKVFVEAELTFDRTRWNLNYGSGGLIGGIGNFAIEDEVSVQINLQAESTVE